MLFYFDLQWLVFVIMQMWKMFYIRTSYYLENTILVKNNNRCLRKKNRPRPILKEHKGTHPMSHTGRISALLLFTGKLVIHYIILCSFSQHLPFNIWKKSTEWGCSLCSACKSWGIKSSVTAITPQKTLFCHNRQSSGID